MKANELMIGDWVKVEDNEFRLGFAAKVAEVYKEAIFTESGENEGECIEEWNVTPIQLTPGILEKNEFRKDDEIDQWYFKSEDRLDLGLLAVGIDDGCGVGFCVMRNGAITYYCKYVHELQHYLRLIGGAEEIIL